MEFSHDQHIGTYENAFSDEWCNKIINYFKLNPKFFSPRTSFHISDIHGEIWDENYQNEFKTIFDSCYNLYTQKYSNQPNSLELTGWKFQKTLPTEGFHTFHCENLWELRNIKRVCAWTLYLNDVEEGGETEFLYQLKRIKPKKGTLCIFPAGYTHVHRGNTPLSGEKYIMTGWLEKVWPDNIEIIEHKLHGR